MGTSTSHRSPVTAEWDRVRELYLTPNPAPGEIVGRIVAALDDAARQRLHDAAVVRCLDSVLAGSADLAEGRSQLAPAQETGSAALDLAGRLRRQAVDRIGADHVASVTGTLALDAIPPTVVAALGPTPAWYELPAETVTARYGRYTTEQDLSVLTGEFCAQDFDRVFRYFVTRDLADHVGEAAAPTVTAAARLVDRVGEFCQARGRPPGLRRVEQDLQEMARLPEEQRSRALDPLVASMIREGLAGLAGG